MYQFFRSDTDPVQDDYLVSGVTDVDFFSDDRRRDFSPSYYRSSGVSEEEESVREVHTLSNSPSIVDTELRLGIGSPPQIDDIDCSEEQETKDAKESSKAQKETLELMTYNTLEIHERNFLGQLPVETTTLNGRNEETPASQSTPSLEANEKKKGKRPRKETSRSPHKVQKINHDIDPQQPDDKMKTRSVRVAVHVKSEASSIPDGGKWKKYGCKKAKGNPNPRSYYRCSMRDNCPVRKQVQRCALDTSVLVTTYESFHNHPLPSAAMPMAAATQTATNMMMSGSMTTMCNSSFALLSSSDPTITLDLTKAVTAVSQLPQVKELKISGQRQGQELGGERQHEEPVASSFTADFNNNSIGSSNANNN